MPWHELHIKATSQHAPHFADVLTLLGAEAVTFRDAGDQPIFEPQQDTPLIWPETIVVGLFDASLEMRPITTYLEEEKANGNLIDFSVHFLGDEDWERRCLDSFQPMQFGKRLWVCPSWKTPPDPNAVNIILDPGLAFGTGTHPTTSLCLEWLEEHIQPGQTVIDYGCGSGILAIAALKLGAKKAYAIDNDPQAITATLANSASNHVSSPQLETHLTDYIIPEQADILVANILAQPLIELASLFGQFIKPKGLILLSGILVDQVNGVTDAYKSMFNMEKPVIKDGWARLSGKRQ